jgi:hypothetical protein
MIPRCDKAVTFAGSGLFLESKNMNIAKEQLTINVSAGFAENLRNTAALFGIEDAGEALEYFAGFVFPDILNGGNLCEELENYEFQTVEQVDRTVTKAAEIVPWLNQTPRAVAEWEGGGYAVRFGEDAIKMLAE